MRNREQSSVTVSAALFNARWTGLLSWLTPWKSQYLPGCGTLVLLYSAKRSVVLLTDVELTEAMSALALTNICKIHHSMQH